MRIRKLIVLFMTGTVAGALYAAPAWAKKPVRSESQLVEKVSAKSDDMFDRKLIWLYEAGSPEGRKNARKIASDDRENMRVVPVRLSSVVDKL